MTFLSITPDAFHAAAIERPTRRQVRRPAPLVAQFMASMIVLGSLTVPGAVASAKWTKLNLIVTFVHQRCLGAMSV